MYSDSSHHTTVRSHASASTGYTKLVVFSGLTCLKTITLSLWADQLLEPHNVNSFSLLFCHKLYKSKEFNYLNSHGEEAQEKPRAYKE